jgi:hypothetical protein
VKRDKIEIELPPIGMFIGSGIYPMSKDYLLSTLHGHQAWMPQSFSPQEMIDKIVSDNQGNLAQFWGYPRGYAPATHAEWLYALDEIGIEIPEPDWEKQTNIFVNQHPLIQEHKDRFGAGALRFIREAAKKDIYTLFIYVSANQKWADEFKNCGKHYLGYDFGERFTFRLDESNIKGKDLKDITLKMLTDDLVDRVREHVDERHATGWGNVMATSINFYIDYEVLAGADVPLLEDFAFQHLNMASALSRGLYRQFDLPMWGSHMAHEHYSWIPNSSEHKFNMFKVGMYQKYMSGCKMIINESGNWFVEATLCEDSPKFDFPRVPLGPTDVTWGGTGEVKFIPYIEEARKHYKETGYDGVIPRRYRKEISDFYDFVKTNGTPAGQPESTIAIAKGNYDLCNHRYSPNSAIAGAYALADKNPAWYESVPERGWDIVKKVFYPLVPVMEPYENAYLSGTPFGQVDIVSLAQEDIDPDFLNANYKALLFSGWNTSSDKQYEVLKKYVANGGTLFISIPQLSTNMTRNYGDYGVDELVNGGDFSELCGVKVKGRGKRIYWATAPDNNTELGFKFPRRFGILTICMGDIEITDPNIEVLAVDDEEADPLVLRHKYGKGQVYFLNSWAYPGAFDCDFGPGSTRNSPGLVGMIYRQIAKDSRGNVYITDDGEEVGEECEYLNYSYFPEAGKIYLYNIDSEKSHGGFLHHFGKSEQFDLAPGEFRQIDSLVQTSSA